MLVEKAAAWSSCRSVIATSIATLQAAGASDGDEQASDGDAEQSYRNRHECITCCRGFGRRCCSLGVPGIVGRICPHGVPRLLDGLDDLRGEHLAAHLAVGVGYNVEVATVRRADLVVSLRDADQFVSCLELGLSPVERVGVGDHYASAIGHGWSARDNPIGSMMTQLSAAASSMRRRFFIGGPSYGGAEKFQFQYFEHYAF